MTTGGVSPRPSGPLIVVWATPKMPVLVGEVCYEGIQEASRQEVQRFMFWACMLSGTAGHTYGANGIWQVNTPEKPYGLSPRPCLGWTGLGSGLQVAWLAPNWSWEVPFKAVFMGRLEPRPELMEPHWSAQEYWRPFAAHIPGETFLAYSPTAWKALTFSGLEPGSHYRAFLFNPSDGSEVPWGDVQTDASGVWKTPEFPIIRDWLVVLDQKA